MLSEPLIVIDSKQYQLVELAMRQTALTKFRWRVPAILCVATALAGCGTAGSSDTANNPPDGGATAEVAPASAESNKTTLVDLSSNLSELREAFNAASGRVRILLLVSPG